MKKTYTVELEKYICDICGRNGGRFREKVYNFDVCDLHEKLYKAAQAIVETTLEEFGEKFKGDLIKKTFDSLVEQNKLIFTEISIPSLKE